jgi:hypothetical protein
MEVFPSRLYLKKVEPSRPVLSLNDCRFAGASAHHQNENAERAIQTPDNHVNFSYRDASRSDSLA